MTENEREMKCAPAREREKVKETNLGLLERLEVSEAAANNFSGSWAPNSLIYHSFITRELQTQLVSAQGWSNRTVAEYACSKM